MSVHLRRTTAAAALASFYLACPAVAQIAVDPQPAAPSDKDQEEPQRDILVVGQQTAPIRVEPRGLSVSLGDEQFAGVNAFDVEDLIKYAPNFFVRKRYVGDNNAVAGFRGTHSTQSARSLVMVDGFVISNFLGNSFAFPPKWNIIGPGEVRQFDIVYGPYSARHTGHSMGGVINIETREVEKAEAFATVQGFVQPFDQYGTKEDLWGYSAEGGFALRPNDGPFSIRLSARRLEADGQTQQFYQLAPATGTAPATAVTGAVIDPDLIVKQPIFGDYSKVDGRQDLVRLKLGYEAGDFRAEALFSYNWNVEDETRPRTYLRDANGAPVYEGRVRFNGQLYNAVGSNLTLRDRRDWLAGLRLEGPLAGFDVRLNLSTFQVDRQRTRISNGYALGVADGAGRLTALGPTDWYTGDLLAERTVGAHRIALGVNANRYRTQQDVFTTTDWRAASGRTFSTRTFGRTRTVGVFAEDEIELADGVSITPGVRVDWWRAYDGGLARLGTGALAGQVVSNGYADRKDSAVSPKLSGQVRLGPNTSAQLSLALTTRFPTVGELFQGSLNGDGTFNPLSFDPNLRPERARDANLILRHDLGPVALTGSLFWQRVNNTIFQFAGFGDTGVLTTRFFNIDVTRQYGAELIAEARNWPIDGMTIEANGAYVDAETIRNRADPLTEGVQFPRIPRWRLNGNVRYDLTPRLQGSLGARFASRPNTDLRGLQRADTYGYISELFALDARLNYDLGRGLRLSAGVDNITNDRAWVFHPYPQRTFIVEAGWRL